MELNEWLILVLLTLVAIGGLLFASGSGGGAEAGFGMLVSVAAVCGIFWRVKQYFDRIDAGRH
ncbi:MAG TPA: hypothetical protein VK741_12840 [Acetobacteraceae bacterium]|jgi:hypothetical protein|nr:hypothetical protein [Acetobacteraceae bacterium]